jgi:anthranilate phosphoribosyltransferase
LAGGTPKENAHTTLKILHGDCSKTDPKLEIVLANAAAGIVVGGKAETLKQGIEIARESIRNRAAYNKLKELVKFSEGNLSTIAEFEDKSD